jgi:hypothetical protein
MKLAKALPIHCYQEHYTSKEHTKIMWVNLHKFLYFQNNNKESWTTLKDEPGKLRFEMKT